MVGLQQILPRMGSISPSAGVSDAAPFVWNVLGSEIDII